MADETVYITQSYTIGEAEEFFLQANDYNTYAIAYGPLTWEDPPEITLVNNGSIVLESTLGAQAGAIFVIQGNSFYYDSLIENNGTIRVSASNGYARAINSLSWTPNIKNTGLIEVSGRTAVGVQSWDAGDNWFENTGDILVSATDGGSIALYLVNGSDVTNSGSIISRGYEDHNIIAISLPHSGTVFNEGDIIAENLRPIPPFFSVAINSWGIGGDADAPFLTNYGLIQGEFAIYDSVDPWYAWNGWIENYGDIRGHVGLANGDDVVINEGSIVGNVLLGGDNDRYDGALGSIDGYVFGEGGVDELIGGASPDSFHGGPGDDVLIGGDGADVLDGSDGRDEVHGGAGDDTLVAYKTNVVVGEVLDGGEGVDTLLVTTGGVLDFRGMQLLSIERLDLRGGDEPAPAGSGVSFAASQVGDGLSASLHLIGAATEGETVTIFGSATDGAPPLDLSGWTFEHGPPALIHVIGGGFADTIVGSSINDVVSGAAGADTLYGGDGNDILNGGDGADRMEGGFGNDIYYVNHAGDVVIEENEISDRNADVVRTSVTFELGAYIEGLTIVGSGARNGTGNASNNVMTGNDAANKLRGLVGNDTINAGAGNDTLDGGTGIDFLRGEAGDDTYEVDSADDFVREQIGGGVDTVRTSTTRALDPNAENLVITGGAARNGSGNSQDNSITGNTAANILSGRLGNDTVVGGGGNDKISGGEGIDALTGGPGQDAFVFDVAAIAANADTITDFSVADDIIHLDNAIFTQLGAAGALNASMFRIGSSPADANDFLFYNSTTGALYYDANANAAGGALRIATFSTGLALTAADFLVI